MVHTGVGQAASGLEVDFLTRGLKNKQLHPDVEIVAYRIVQEGLINMVEHAHADQAQVHITYSHPNLILKIMDNGIGFDPEAAFMKAIRQKHGIGLISMKERPRHWGERYFTIKPGKGTVIRAVIPMKKGGAG